MGSSRRNATPGSSPGGTIGQWLFLFVVTGSVVAVGSVHTVTLCVVTALLAVSAGLVWWDAEPMRTRPAANILFLAGVALTLYTAFQCVPIPVGWLSRMAAPHTARTRGLERSSPLHERGLELGAALSGDPSATRVEVLKGVAYLLTFVTALAIARRREGGGLLIATIVVTGLVLAATAVLHPAFGAQRLFGAYASRGRGSRRVTSRRSSIPTTWPDTSTWHGALPRRWRQRSWRPTFRTFSRPIGRGGGRCSSPRRRPGSLRAAA